MRRPTYQVSVAAIAGVIAGIALNIWLFRVGIWPGIVGLSISKHLAVAYLCRALGVDRKRRLDLGAAPAEIPPGLR